METERDVLLLIGDWIIAVGIIPTAVFTLDYGLFRWRRRRRKSYTVQILPWWTSGVGIMIFMLALGALCTQGVVIASLFLGPEYWGREIFRIVGYMVATTSQIVLLGVYAIEGHKADSVMAPRATGTPTPR